MYYEDKSVTSSATKRPKSLKVTPTAVYVRREIEEFTEEVDGEARQGWRYKESKYDKDVYIEKLTKRDEEISQELDFTSSAVYELMSIVLND